ncbi:hypothetical protein K435DRAFT_862546 [Dendrothele bispora CBS 962.96]|uniref:Hydrophobin n=1 Tax=Dendrothele bispora (strain CBS 962.96) TaxID=1314807 RepID=A0A4S8LS95_DENBC|nr:hypothetical protein K435DRAFT_862546 [Dendrothele bispora CBS 962.96]
MFLLVIMTLVSSSAACKCVTNGANQVGATESCCNSLGGDFNTDDCAAGSISEHLSNFRSCCQSSGAVTSDCDFP